MSEPERWQMWHRRLPKFEAFDKITLEVVPRYKTSGMSGDEWRTSVAVRFFFKGHEIHEEWVRDMEAAILMLGSSWIKAQEPIPSEVIKIEERKCDQPGCSADAAGRLKVKRLTADDGSWLDSEERSGLVPYRRFCTRHIQRGDCSREDSDDNYEPMDGLGFEDSTNIEESPAATLIVDAAYFLGGTSEE